MGLGWSMALHKATSHSWAPGACEVVLNVAQTRQWPVASRGHTATQQQEQEEWGGVWPSRGGALCQGVLGWIPALLTSSLEPWSSLHGKLVSGLPQTPKTRHSKSLMSNRVVLYTNIHTSSSII